MLTASIRQSSEMGAPSLSPFSGGETEPCLWVSGGAGRPMKHCFPPMLINVGTQFYVVKSQGGTARPDSLAAEMGVFTAFHFVYIFGGGKSPSIT